MGVWLPLCPCYDSVLVTGYTSLPQQRVCLVHSARQVPGTLCAGHWYTRCLAARGSEGGSHGRGEWWGGGLKLLSACRPSREGASGLP